MSLMSRKCFVNVFVAVISSIFIGCITNIDNDFLDDIYDDRYYILKGGIYENSEGYGCSGKNMRCILIKNLKYILDEQTKFKDQCITFNKYLDYIEKNGFYFEVSSHFPYSNDEDHKHENKKILLTKEWLINFYNKHIDQLRD